MSNSDKWIIITGASSGIGKATAEKLLDEGYKVVLTSRNKDKLEKVFNRFNSNILIVPFDLSKIEKLDEYVEKIIKTTGPISGFVHCAGIRTTIPLNFIKLDNILSLFTINTFSAIRLISLLSKSKNYNHDGASFVLISSIAAHEGAKGVALYASTKGALEGFLTPAASELIAKNIRINIVVPGIIETEMIQDFFKNLTDPQIEAFKKSYPLGIGKPEYIANFIHYLVSDKAKWITGQKFILDGGHLIRGN